MTGSSRHTNLSDEELLASYRLSGDVELLGALLQRYTTLLLGVAMKYLKDRTQAEDAVQQVFLKALTHLPKDQINNFKGWLYILMRNHCLQQLRDKQVFSSEEQLDNVAGDATGNDDMQQKEYTLQQMEECLGELSAEQRISITLFYLQKCSYDQIISQTGFTFMQVKSYIQNGKRNLRLILEKKLGKMNK